MSSLVITSRARAGQPVVSTMLGALVGLIAGVAIDGAIWLWAFGRALEREAATSIPLLVTTDPERGGVTATAEIGVLLLPLTLMTVCASCALCIALTGRRRERRKEHATR